MFTCMLAVSLFNRKMSHKNLFGCPLPARLQLQCYFHFQICSDEEVKVRFWGDKVEEVNDRTKSHVIAVTSTTVRKFGSKS